MSKDTKLASNILPSESEDTQQITNHKSPITILGLDPGLADLGWGVIENDKGTCKMLGYGSIQTPAKQDFIYRLLAIKQELTKLIKTYRPTIAGVEELFFAKNTKTALLVAQARGVALSALADNDLKIFEATPLEIKMSLTGYGRASKDQIGKMVMMILQLKTMPKPDDAADALAVAITAAHSIKMLDKQK